MEQVTVTLKHTATKVHSERYSAADRDAPVRDIYLMKSAFKSGETRPDTITVTITVVG